MIIFDERYQRRLSVPALLEMSNVDTLHCSPFLEAPLAVRSLNYSGFGSPQVESRLIYELLHQHFHFIEYAGFGKALTSAYHPELGLGV